MENIFEWVDGPLVEAMKGGHLLLIDEINMASDSVLERLNSVLEPEKTLTISELNVCIESQDGLVIVATMNPGNDHGKKELSPALRNRFTEVWVESMTTQHTIKSQKQEVKEMLIEIFRDRRDR